MSQGSFPSLTSTIFNPTYFASQVSSLTKAEADDLYVPQVGGSVSSFFNSLGTTNLVSTMTGTTCNIRSLYCITASITNVAYTNLTLTNLTATSATMTNVKITNLTATNVYCTTITGTNAILDDVDSLTFTCADSTCTNLNITNIFKVATLTTTDKNNLANITGCVVFDTTLGKLSVNIGSGWQNITGV